MRPPVNIKTLFAKLLLILNVLQIIAPMASIQAAPKGKTTDPLNNLHLPSRKAFKELTACWEGLEPAAYVKDTSDAATGEANDQIAKFVGAQRAALKDSSKSRPLFEALNFLNNLATSGKAIHNTNCTKRLMMDMQMFGDKGLHKAFNRTILALGQTLQLAQLYEGAESAKIAEERRDFITEILKTPEGARALSIRIKCFGQYENQFLRQTNTPRNKFLEKKINALAPSRVARALSRLVGYRKNSANFLKWHARLTQKTANIPFIGYDAARSAYIFSTTWIATHLLWQGRFGGPNRWAKGGTQQQAEQAKAAERAAQVLTPEQAESKATRDALFQTGKDTGVALAKVELKIPDILITVLKNFFSIISKAAFNHGFKDAMARQSAKKTLSLSLEKAFTLKGARELTSNAFSAVKNNGATKLVCDVAAGPLLPFAALPEISKASWNANKAKINTREGQDSKKAMYDALVENAGSWRFPSLRLDGYEALSNIPRNFQIFCKEALQNHANTIKGYFHENKDGKEQTFETILKEWWKNIDLLGWQNAADQFVDTQRAFEDSRFKASLEAFNRPGTRFYAYVLSWFTPPWVTAIYNQIPGIASPGLKQIWDISNNPQMGPLIRALTSNYTSIAKAGVRYLKIATSTLVLGFKFPIFKQLITTSVAMLKAIPKIKPAIETGVDLFFEAKDFVKKVLENAYISIPDPLDEQKKGKIAILPQIGVTDLIEAASQVLIDRKIPTNVPVISMSRLVQSTASAADAVEKTEPEKCDDGSTKYLSKDEAFRVAEAIASNLDIGTSTIVTTSEEYQKRERTRKLLGLGTLSGGVALETILMAGFLASGQLWANFVLESNQRVFTIDILDQYMFDSLKPSIALAEMVHQIGSILLAHKSTIPLPTSLQEKLNFLMTSASPECKEFAQAARNPMFLKKNKPGRFGNFGIIRKAYQLAGTQSVKQWLNTCAVFMAEVDSYLAIARLTAEHKDHPNFFSPVTFIEQETPHIKLSGFWFPIISPFISIANNITIGKPAHILLTGINGGGKTVTIKGMVFSILMAHTWGYAPLAEGEMTFMTKIITHLSSTDNAAEGDSCWIAEAKSMGKALHEMQAPRRPGELILYIGDELGSGTADHAAIAAVAQFMEIALTTPHVASIISTHLRPLTQLEEISGGMVLNYRVGGTVDAAGTILRKYLIERGIADINIAELIVNQLLEHGHQKTAVHPDNKIIADQPIANDSTNNQPILVQA